MRRLAQGAELNRALVKGLLDRITTACVELMVSFGTSHNIIDLENLPKHVLFPPVINTHHSSG